MGAKAFTGVIFMPVQSSAIPAVCIKPDAAWLTALRQNLERLPAQDRSLLGLCYGVGLSFDEAARCAGISRQKAVSRVRSILDELRGRLSTAGASPISEDALKESICSVFEAPPTLRDRVLERLTESRFQGRAKKSSRYNMPSVKGENHVHPA